jgi:hypothetical protein
MKVGPRKSSGGLHIRVAATHGKRRPRQPAGIICAESARGRISSTHTFCDASGRGTRGDEGRRGSHVEAEKASATGGASESGDALGRVCGLSRPRAAALPTTGSAQLSPNLSLCLNDYLIHF